MNGWKRDLAILLAGAALVLAILFGVRAFEGRKSTGPGAAPSIYIISASRISLPDADYWLVQYAMDGKPYGVEIPVEKNPDEFLAYLGKIGPVQTWAEKAKK